MTNQLLENGKVVEVNGEQLECSAVSYQEDPETQERHSFVYSFRLKSEIDTEREAEAKHQEELKVAEENQPKTEEETI